MKEVKDLLCKVCIWMTVFSLLLSGCSILDKKEEKVRDLEIITGIAQSLVEDFDKLDLSAL